MKLHELTEAKSPLADKLFYHGTHAVFDHFDLNFIGKGNDQDGPGFYFSDDLDTAVYHANGGRILACHLTPRKVIRSTGRVPETMIRTMIAQSPIKDDVLMNFDEDPQRAFGMALAAMILANDPKESFERVWYDFYRHDAKAWAEHLIRFGYDGILVPQQDSLHVIMVNPDRIEIVKVIDDASVTRQD